MNGDNKMKRGGLATRLSAATVSVAALCFGTGALAKLPPPTDEQKAKADEAKAKTAWSDKVAAYQLCKAQDRTASHYYNDMKAKGKEAKPAAALPACMDPGPYVAGASAAAAPTAIAGGPSTAPIAAPSDHKPAAAPASAVQSRKP
jgi:hypothetical protein